MLLVMGLGLVVAQSKRLEVFTWTEYIDPMVIAAFEERTGIQVRLTYYETNEEMLERLKAGGLSEFDLIIPSDYVVPEMLEAGLLHPLNHSQIPNLKNLDSKFASPPFDPGNNYTVGYLWGMVGLLYRTDVFTTAPTSWNIIFDPKHQKGPFTLIDSYREMLSIVLRYTGQSVHSVNQGTLDRVIDLLAEAKRSKKARGFQPGVSAIELMKGNKAVAAMVYNQDALGAIEHRNYGFTVPKEGSTLFLDNLAIPARAPHPDAAHKFINFVLEPRIGARIADYMSAATPNAAAKAYVRKSNLNNPAIWPKPEHMNRLEFAVGRVPNSSMLQRAWASVQSR
jgi:spermidine/putrescine transport system substrate-binding protein